MSRSGSHNFRKIRSVILTAMLSFVSLACMKTNLTAQTAVEADTPGLSDIEFTVTEASEWTALFKRNTGWIGADGIFSIPLNGKRHHSGDPASETAFIFSDTLIGEISDGNLQPGWSMVNNTIAYLKGTRPVADSIRFEWSTDNNNRPISLFTPGLPSADEGDYYWLGDGFVNTELDSSIYIFAYRMRNLDPDQEWSFAEMSTDLIVLPKNSTVPFSEQRQIETPLRFKEGGFGAGILVNTDAGGAPRPDGFIYVYGVRNQEKNLMIARVLPEDFENFDAWRFWDGDGWSTDIERVKNVVSRVSHELSVTPLPDGRYALVFTRDTLSPVVGMRLAPTPYGPFGPIIEVYETDVMEQNNIIAYNAKAHPSLSAPGELLISYNVNAFDFMNEISKDPNLYRPRFIRLKFR
mgnify:CR=1 FL=1